MTGITTGDSSRVYSYDTLGRISNWTTKHGNDTVFSDEFTFAAPTGTAVGTTTGQIARHYIASSHTDGLDIAYTYTYDDNGNILSISDGTNTTSYVYDTANQLLRENNQAANKTYVWTYDNAGNILSRNEYAYTTAENPTNPVDAILYTYGDTNWGDLLTAYDGQVITYDTIGNPLTDGTWNYSWEHGRQLASMSDSSTTWNFAYNSDGLRTSRSDSSTIYEYVYNGSSLSQMTVGTNVLTFSYDANGLPMSVAYNGTTYYYITNLQGDVIGILDSTGATVVTYTYDAWGNILSTGGTLSTTLGIHNPLRYRGYVYDPETSLYYLQSRYYNPEIGRFINADAFASTGQGLLGSNMFAYCLCNPINYFDSNGQDAIWIQEGDSAAGFGHSGLLIQDSDGNWYYFYWGPYSEDTFIPLLIIGVFGRLVYEKVSVDDENLNTPEGVRNVLAQSANTFISSRAGKVTDIIYFKGDYTKTHQYLTMQKQREVSNNEKTWTPYDLLERNCVQRSVYALALSNNYFTRYIICLIPNLVYKNLKEAAQLEVS